MVNVKNVICALFIFTMTSGLLAMQVGPMSLESYKAILETGNCEAIVKATKGLGGVANGCSLHIKLERGTNRLCVQGFIQGMSKDEQRPYKDALLAFMLDLLRPYLDGSLSTGGFTKNIGAIFTCIDQLTGEKEKNYGVEQFTGILHDGLFGVNGKELQNKVADYVRMAVCLGSSIDASRYSVSFTNLPVTKGDVQALFDQAGVMSNNIEVEILTVEPTKYHLLDGSNGDDEPELEVIGSHRLCAGLLVAVPFCAVLCYLAYKKYRTDREVEQGVVQDSSAEFVVLEALDGRSA